MGGQHFTLSETFSAITEGGTQMRVVSCFCGQCIAGTTDTDHFQRNRDHQNQAHPTHQTTEAQIWAVIKANAYEERDIRYHEQVNPEHQTSADELTRHRHRK